MIASFPERDVPTLVVVGNGMVAHRLCHRLRDRGAPDRIVVLGEEPRPAYDRVHLTDCLGGRAPEELELPALAPCEAPIEHHVGERVVEIDRQQRLVRTAAGRRVPYDRLVLAMGSTPRIPPIHGTETDGVFVYRTIEDVQSIHQRALQVRSAAVIGGGLLGLEAARALVDLGLQVQLVEVAPHLLHLQLDARAAAVLRSRVEGRGIRVRVAAETRAIRAGPADTLILELAGGDSLQADMVVLAAGILPRDDLARSCGLACAETGGVLVDPRMRTSDPRVWAVGECASVEGRTFGLVAPTFHMADVAVDDLLGGGGSRRFHAPEHTIRLKLVESDVGVVGNSLGELPGVRQVEWRGGEDYRKLVLRGRELVGAACVGTWPELERIQEAVRERRWLWPWELVRFRTRGRIWSRYNQRNVEELPERATVCSCLGVTRGELSAAKAHGASTLEALATATGASTVCGLCATAVRQMVDPDARFRAPARSLGLLATSIAVASAVAMIAFAAPLEPSPSFLRPRRLEYLWAASTWLQVSGALMLAVALTALALSLRKRWRGFSLGSRARWRLFHALVSLGSLGLLAVHTGLAQGERFNQVLFFSYLVVAATGAPLGLLFSFHEIRPVGAAWRARRALWWIHVLLLWPLPVLVLFHVIAVYRF